MISSWVTEAWRSTGCREALWYATLSTEFHERWGPLNDEVGLWFEGSAPPATPTSELVAQVHCTDDLLTRKNRALQAHASQTRPLETLVGAEVYRDWWATESFVAASPDARHWLHTSSQMRAGLRQPGPAVGASTSRG